MALACKRLRHYIRCAHQKCPALMASFPLTKDSDHTLAASTVTKCSWPIRRITLSGLAGLAGLVLVRRQLSLAHGYVRARTRVSSESNPANPDETVKPL